MKKRNFVSIISNPIKSLLKIGVTPYQLIQSD